MSHTIHIRKDKPPHRHYNCTTLCGQRVHSTRTICHPKSKVRINLQDDANRGVGYWDTTTGKWTGTPGHMDILFTISVNQADQMDDIYEGSQQRGDLWVPSPFGPNGASIRVREMVWCEDCFEDGMRALKLLARSEI